jgi:hypothetical protein
VPTAIHCPRKATVLHGRDRKTILAWPFFATDLYRFLQGFRQGSIPNDWKFAQRIIG